MTPSGRPTPPVGSLPGPGSTEGLAAGTTNGPDSVGVGSGKPLCEVVIISLEERKEEELSINLNTGYSFRSAN